MGKEDMSETTIVGIEGGSCKIRDDRTHRSKKEFKQTGKKSQMYDDIHVYFYVGTIRIQNRMVVHIVTRRR